MTGAYSRWRKGNSLLIPEIKSLFSGPQIIGYTNKEHDKGTLSCSLIILTTLAQLRTLRSVGWYGMTTRDRRPRRHRGGAEVYIFSFFNLCAVLFCTRIRLETKNSHQNSHRIQNLTGNQPNTCPDALRAI